MDGDTGRRRQDHTHRGLSRDSGGRMAAAVFLAFTLGLPATALAQSSSPAVDVVVRETHPATDAAEHLVETLGGSVTTDLPVIGGFAATVPASALDTLRGSAEVLAATLDTTLAPRWDQTAQWGSRGRSNSLPSVEYTVGADDYHRAGYTGQGVDVALIDTGVAPVRGLDGSAKVVDALDISFESQDPDLTHLDTNGHGTHMAGIIASSVRRDRNRTGVAPGARIVNVKVAGHDGAVDVSQVIAAIDWVVQHRHDGDLDIRVLNLSYGTDSTQDPAVDPLAFAVEQAWMAGIVVVVAAGNEGPDAPLNDPATNPSVIAVGADDQNGTRRTFDDRVADFSSCGVDRTVDLVAPGVSIRSLRVPGSVADVEHPEARIGRSLFKGSGTSQAAAVVSGAAALIISQRPDITPDGLKALLMESATPLRRDQTACQGAGLLDLDAAMRMDTPDVTQTHPPATGTGSLDAARGTGRVTMDGVTLGGEVDIFGVSWSAELWAAASAAGTSWSGDEWNGTSWSSGSWSGTSWSGTSWSGTSWSENTWTGTSWTSGSWSSGSWSSVAWTGVGWN